MKPKQSEIHSGHISNHDGQVQLLHSHNLLCTAALTTVSPIKAPVRVLSPVA